MENWVKILIWIVLYTSVSFIILMFLNHGAKKGRKLLGSIIIAIGIDTLTPPYPSSDALWLLPIFLTVFKMDLIKAIPLYIITSLTAGVVLIFIGIMISGLKWGSVKKKLVNWR